MVREPAVFRRCIMARSVQEDESEGDSEGTNYVFDQMHAVMSEDDPQPDEMCATASTPSDQSCAKSTGRRPRRNTPR